MTLVPTIDIDRSLQSVAAELDEVCREVGFFQIVGHGVPAGIADAAWDAAHAFFDLPLADRMAVAQPHEGYPYGYIPMARETLSRSLDTSGAPDLKEVFNVGPVDPPRRPMTDPGEAEVFSPNLWPDALPELRRTWEPYYREMLALSARVMGAFALALELPEDFFADRIDESPSALRALNYPHQDAEPAPGQLRAGAHTDYGTLTILRQDDAPGGLEVRDPHGDQWVPIPSVPGAFVINIGDLMARWTNDRWRSTLHRVVNPPRDSATSTRRQSIPFFNNANYGCVVECLPTCISPDEQPKYAPVVAGPHLMGKFRKTVYTSS